VDLHAYNSSYAEDIDTEISSSIALLPGSTSIMKDYPPASDSSSDSSDEDDMAVIPDDPALDLLRDDNNDDDDHTKVDPLQLLPPIQEFIVAYAGKLFVLLR
jgi:hypothetical protein